MNIDMTEIGPGNNNLFTTYFIQVADMTEFGPGPISQLVIGGGPLLRNNNLFSTYFNNILYN